MEGVVLFSFENEVFACFAFYASLVLLKVMLTAGTVLPFHRVTGNVYLTNEDVRCWSPPGSKPNRAIAERIELLRRIVANDLENIPIFILLGIFYTATQPSPSVAFWHFRLFAVGRYLHTFIYLLQVQPYRLMAFVIGYLVNLSIAVQVLLELLGLKHF